jgi:DoxX-like family
MQLEPQSARGSKKLVWAWRILTALATLFLLMDSIMHLLKPVQVVDAFARLGFPLNISVELAIIELLCLVIYLIPGTAILGAILITGYLGGAVAINMRAGEPLFETIFPVLFGILVWAWIYLRDEKLRHLLPLRR